MKRFQRAGVQKFIKFCHTAQNVEYLENESKFKVRYTDLVKKKDYIQFFDYVIVAAGHFSYPMIPKLNGIQKFKGKVAHSNVLRQFHEFKNKRVLVLGGSFSAEDVALQCFKYGAQKIIWTYRSLRMKYNLDNIPKNIEMRSGLSHFDKYHAYFENGDKIQIDAVLLCTGYIHHFPFMEQSLRLNCPQPDIYWPEGLYYSVAYQKNPKLFYVGMGSYRLSQVFFDLQGYLIRDIISGKHIVPEYIKQRRHPKDLQRQQDMKNAKTGQDYMDSGLRYAKDIIKMTGYPDFDIDKFSPIYTANEEDRAENFLTYRDRRIFQSIHTGQWSCIANKTWLQMKQVEPTHQQSGEQIRAYFNFNQSPSL